MKENTPPSYPEREKLIDDLRNCAKAILLGACPDKKEGVSLVPSGHLRVLAGALRKLNLADAIGSGEEREPCPACTKGGFPHRNCILR
jgi:hypothetical protein